MRARMPPKTWPAQPRTPGSAAASSTILPMQPIAHIRTDLPQKFGLPRQSGLAPHLRASIRFEPEFALPNAVKGLEGFSHLWLIWQIENGVAGGTAQDVATDTAKSSSPKQAQSTHWSPTVRPPLLGGSERVGVFATRSPFRPNPIGLSCVELESVEITEDGPVLHVLGADLRDMTPILDIKPYVPHADCRPDARGGFTDTHAWETLKVEFPQELLEKIPQEKRAGLVELLEQDPNPVGRKRNAKARANRLAYAGFEVLFTTEGKHLTVTSVHPAL